MERKEEVIHWFQTEFPQVKTVGRGGSVTLDQLNISQILRDRGMTVYYHGEASQEERRQVMEKAMFSDIYLSSVNALLADGSLFNVDGNGNRVAALIFGPQEAIYVVGKNKIVANLTEAEERLKTIASPQNVARLQYPAGCLKTGRCIDCNSPKRICNAYTLLKRAPWAVKSTVILVNEDLGY